MTLRLGQEEGNPERFEQSWPPSHFPILSIEIINKFTKNTKHPPRLGKFARDAGMNMEKGMGKLFWDISRILTRFLMEIEGIGFALNED